MPRHCASRGSSRGCWSSRAPKTRRSPAVAVELAPLVGRRSERWRDAATEAGMTLIVSVPPALAARAAGDRIEQVLDNLLANAVTASPRGGTIEVSARRAGQRVELHVRDHGPGLSDEAKERAFDRFWRGRETGGGSGLGLSIVRRLAERDGGSVELCDAPGEGLEAIVRWPV